MSWPCCSRDIRCISMLAHSHSLGAPLSTPPAVTLLSTPGTVLWPTADSIVPCEWLPTCCHQQTPCYRPWVPRSAWASLLFATHWQYPDQLFSAVGDSARLPVANHSLFLCPHPSSTGRSIVAVSSLVLYSFGETWKAFWRLFFDLSTSESKERWGVQDVGRDSAFPETRGSEGKRGHTKAAEADSADIGGESVAVVEFPVILWIC